MKKYLLLFFLIFLTTGCDVKYNLTINTNSYDEKVNLSVYSDDTLYGTIENNTADVTLKDENKKYTKKIKKQDSKYTVLYQYKHNNDSIKKSKFITSCFKTVNIDNSNDNISLSASDFNCIYMDDGVSANSVEVNIKTNLKVLDNNADKVFGNTYIWKFDGNNYSDKKIEFKAKKGFQLKTASKSASFTLLVIILPILLIGFIIYKVIMKKTKNNNSF